MTISHSPAPARSDVAAAAPGTETGPPRPFLLHGRMLTAGALAWSASILAVGQDPGGTAGLLVFGLGSGLFQVGLLFLLRTLWLTQALGEGRRGGRAASARHACGRGEVVEGRRS